MALALPTAPPSRRFPGADRTDPQPDAVAWIGGPGPLREAVADRMAALGTELADSPGAAALTIIDAAALGRTESPGHAGALVVTDAQEIPAELWRAGLTVGARGVFSLPRDSQALLDAAAQLLRPSRRGRVIGVVGACGGAGASSTAARLAGASARAGRTVALVDADPWGGGLDVLVEAAEAPGARWTEIGDEPADGAAVLDSLPEVDGVRLLAGDLPPGSSRTVLATLAALAQATEDVVVDLDAASVPTCASALDHLLMVLPATEHALSAAATRVDRWASHSLPLALVVRRRADLSPAECSELLGVPVAAVFADERRSAVPLLDVRRSGADRACRRLILELNAGTESSAMARGRRAR